MDNGLRPRANAKSEVNPPCHEAITEARRILHLPDFATVDWLRPHKTEPFTPPKNFLSFSSLKLGKVFINGFVTLQLVMANNIYITLYNKWP